MAMSEGGHDGCGGWSGAVVGSGGGGGEGGGGGGGVKVAHFTRGQ